MLKCYSSNPYVHFYALTVSPRNPDTDIFEVIKSVKDLFKICKNVLSVRYVIEKSPKGKDHIHGILCCRNKSKFMKIRRHPVCHFQIDPFESEGWVGYMGKGHPDICYGMYYNEGKLIIPEHKLDWYLIDDTDSESGDD